MAKFSEEKIETVWNSANAIDGVDSTEWRQDACNAWINRKSYGQETIYGWEIDHILPIAKGGTDHTENLRAIHWKNNRSKGDDFPNYESSVTSEGNKNIYRDESKEINKDTILKLRIIYPNNKHM
jgi:hypothetical protein